MKHMNVSGTRGARRRIGGTSLFAGLLVAAVALTACSTTKPPSAASGKSYCAGRTVTFLAPDDPGGNSDVQMRVIAPVISKALGCTIHVTDAPQGDTVVGQDLVAHAAPDGLTVGYLQVSKDVYNEGIGKKTIDFKADSVQFLASTQGTPNVIIVAPNSPYHTFSDIINSPTPVKILSTGGSGSMTITMLMAAYGKKADLVGGYSSSADLVQGFLRGDGQVTNSALSALQTIIADGKARAILMDTTAPEGSEVADKIKNVQLYADMLKQTPPTDPGGDALMKNLVNYRAAPSDWYFVPQGTPANVMRQLRSAFAKALQDPGVQKKLAALSVEGYVPGEQGLKYVKEMEAIIPDVKKYASS